MSSQKETGYLTPKGTDENSRIAFMYKLKRLADEAYRRKAITPDEKELLDEFIKQLHPDR